MNEIIFFTNVSFKRLKTVQHSHKKILIQFELLDTIKSFKKLFFYLLNFVTFFVA